MIAETIFGMGVLITMIGMCSMDSENMLYPIAMIATGMIVAFLAYKIGRISLD